MTLNWSIKWLIYAKKRAAENAKYVFTAYAMAILKLQFWHITGWLEFAEREWSLTTWSAHGLVARVTMKSTDAPITSTTKTPDFTT
jgi:hypothetical protein